jgi:hypothetical protein
MKLFNEYAHTSAEWSNLSVSLLAEPPDNKHDWKLINTKMFEVGGGYSYTVYRMVWTWHRTMKDLP